MRVIIAGSRTINDYQQVVDAVKYSGFDITEVVSGHANGVDKLGERWAKEHNIPVKLFPAEWGKRGKKAGIIRNTEMAKYASALILIWSGWSMGSANMKQTAKDFELPIFEKVVKCGSSLRAV